MTVDTLPTYDESSQNAIRQSREIGGGHRIPTYEGATHGKLPHIDRIRSYLKNLYQSFAHLAHVGIGADEETGWMYLAAAEQRYLLFLRIRSQMMIIPPMDVAIIWLTHLENPYRYWEDMSNHFPAMLEVDYPLTEIAEQFTMIGEWVDSKESTELWRNFTDDAYRLSTRREDLFSRHVLYHFNETKIDFTLREWTYTLRHPHVQFEVNGNILSGSILSLEKFIHNIKASRLNSGSVMLDDANPAAATLSMQRILFDLPELSPCLEESTRSPDGLTWDKLRRQMRYAIIKHGIQKSREEKATLSWESANRNILTPFGMSLVQATQTRYSSWLKLFPATSSFHTCNAFEAYERFLRLFLSTEEALVPTAAIELALRTHLTSPREYRAFTYGILGHYLAHDAVQGLHECPVALARTRRLWTDRYSTSYDNVQPTKIAKIIKFGQVKELDCTMVAYEGLIVPHDTAHIMPVPKEGNDNDTKRYLELLKSKSLDIPELGSPEMSFVMDQQW